MPINLVISEICCNFKALTYKQLQTKISIITKDKVTEIFCMADDFCKFFDAMTAKYTLKATEKRKYHRNSTMSKAEVMLIMILFHDSGYRCFKPKSVIRISQCCMAVRNPSTFPILKETTFSFSTTWPGIGCACLSFSPDMRE